MKKLTKINKKEKRKGFLCSLFREIWGFRKKDRKKQSTTKSTPGFEKLSTALTLAIFPPLSFCKKRKSWKVIYICINSFNFLYWFRKFMASYITNSGLLTSLIKILDNSTIALQRPNARRKRRHSYVQVVVAYTCGERDSQHSILERV